MTRPDAPTTGRERKVHDITDFAADLHSKLSHSSSCSSPDLLLADISHQICEITTLCQKSPIGLSYRKGKVLERHGRDLWNLCIRLKRDGNNGKEAKLLIRTRLFAFHLLELGRSPGRGKSDAESEIVYLIGLVLTLARLCLEGEDLDAARAALQKAAEYVERLKEVSSHNKGRIRLEADYLAMRIALSWKESRLDVAEHMYGKTEAMRANLDVGSAEIMADTLRHIGADLSLEGDFPMAIKWLKRAYDTINSQELEHLSIEGLDTRLAICQSLIQSFLGTASPESISEANDLVDYVQSEIGDKPLVLHWRLEISQKSPDELFDAETYASILRRMVHVFDFSDRSFQFLLHHIKELRNKSPRLACGLLDELLTQRILKSQNMDWLNKTIVRRVWMSTMETDMSDSVIHTGLVDILNAVQEAIAEPLSPDATGAVHSLIWKKIEAVTTKQQYEIGDQWCLIALHDIFSNSGEPNQAKFGRKRILCALGLNDAEKARVVFSSMSETVQNDPLTRYLMFKVSLLDWDHELGCQSIGYLSKFADDSRSQEMLYACIREAQQVGDKLCTLAALKAVVESWNPGREAAGSLPSILRCSVRLIKMIEEQEKKSGLETLFVEDICKTFETAAEYAKQNPKDQEDNKIFTVQELHWFRKNAYNIGAARCSTWDLQPVIRIFTTCLTFTSSLPPDLPLKETEDLALMAMRSNFIIAAALLSLARTEDQVDVQLQRYLEMRRHVAAFDDALGTKAEMQNGVVIGDLMGKLATLLVFDFEGAVVLKAWEDLGGIVRKGGVCRDVGMLKAMGDCLLRSRAPGKVMFKTMRLIINDIFTLEQFDNEKLGKYIRCMFQAILPLDEVLALQLLDEAAGLARDGAQVGKPFPHMELEWLVATTFNHAIDFYAHGEEDPCHRWALRAMDLAAYLEDNGQLQNVLQAKFAKLRFEKVDHTR